MNRLGFTVDVELEQDYGAEVQIDEFTAPKQQRRRTLDIGENRHYGHESYGAPVREPPLTAEKEVDIYGNEPFHI